MKDKNFVTISSIAINTIGKEKTRPLFGAERIIDTFDGILIPLIAVGLAEMGDKTQLSILLLSSRTRDYARLLFGVMLAFFLADGFAILVGSWVTGIIPMNIVKLISGAVFILFGVLILRGDSDDDGSESTLSPNGAFISGFSMIFLSEWGDKTQIASALFATEFNPWMVLIGVMLALLMLSLMAIYLGRFLSTKVDKRLITRAAGIVFLGLGLFFILSAFSSSTFADIFS